jgi:glycosyltransferase involved in cell wall biosynthesis
MTWMNESVAKSSTVAVARLCARLSRRVPHEIVFNSEAARRSHAAHGYSLDRAVILPNAVDVRRFAPAPEAGRELRDALGLAGDALIVGQAARFDPQKGHIILLRALPNIVKRHPSVHLVLLGPRCSPDNDDLVSLIASTGMPDRVHLLGARVDVHRITAGFDIAVSASIYGESFPNAVVEALACGVPVVATDIGAAGELVGRSGRVVTPGSAVALGAAVIELLDLTAAERRALGQLGRSTVAHHAVDEMVERYAVLHETVASR